MSDRTCPRCGAELELGLESCAFCILEHASRKESEVFVDCEIDDEAETPDIEELRRLLPGFEISRRIGRGGMAVVYEARDRKLARSVALKFLDRELSKDPDFVQRFLREARALAALNHPNIVTIHDFGREEGLCYLVMELVEGTDLRQLIATGELGPDEALALVPQVCDALQYAHERGVVHRDIKPENILVRSDGVIKIADFGIAKMADSERDLRLTHSRLVVGTPQYMAPEQIERPLEVDHRADIYALGVVLYEMLTGELPLGRFDLPSSRVALDVRIDEVVLRSLEKAPERRFQKVSEVKTEVDHIRSTPQPEARPSEASREAATRTTPEAKGLTNRQAWPLLLASLVAIFYVVHLLAREQSVLEGMPTELAPLGFAETNELVRGGDLNALQDALGKGRPHRGVGEEGLPHPFFVAALEQDLLMLKALIGALPGDVDRRNAEGDTALIVAIDQGFHDGALELLEHEADPGLVGARGRTALLAAAERGDRRTLSVLLKRLPRKDQFPRDDRNEGPMHKAARSGDPRIVTLLHQAGIEGAFLDDRDMTPLDLAVARGDRALMPVLLAAGEHETPAYLLMRFLDERRAGERDLAGLERLLEEVESATPAFLELGHAGGQLWLKTPEVSLRLLKAELLAERRDGSAEIRASTQEGLENWPEDLMSLDVLVVRNEGQGPGELRYSVTRDEVATMWPRPGLRLESDAETTAPAGGHRARLVDLLLALE